MPVGASPPIFIPYSSSAPQNEDDGAAAEASPDEAAEYREYIFWRRISRDGRYPASAEHVPTIQRRRTRSDHRVAFADVGAPTNAATSLIFALDN